MKVWWRGKATKYNKPRWLLNYGMSGPVVHPDGMYRHWYLYIGPFCFAGVKRYNWK